MATIQDGQQYYRWLKYLLKALSTLTGKLIFSPRISAKPDLMTKCITNI